MVDGYKLHFFYFEVYIKQTPLHCAAQNEHLEIVKLLLEKGANFNSKEIFGWVCMLYIIFECLY